MKKIIILLTLISTIAFSQQKKVLLVIIDGVPTDVLLRNRPATLDSLSFHGAFSPSMVGGRLEDPYTSSPTISAVGYNTMLTGVWSNKHNVWGNSIKNPNYNYPTIFKAFKDAYPNKKIGIYSTWEDNRTKLIGEGLKENNNLKIDFVYDGYEKDTINFPHTKDRIFIKNIDQYVVDQAEKSIQKDAPDLAWVYLEWTDDIGHMYGDGLEQDSALLFTDKLIHQLSNAVKYRQDNFNEEWAMIITTDHGRDEKTGKNHGGQSPRQRDSWVVTNHKDVNKYFRNYTIQMVDIFPSVASFLDIPLDDSLKYELDGVDLFGEIDIVRPKIKKDGDMVIISWEEANLDDKGIEIYASATDNFNIGKSDKYLKIGEAKKSDEKFEMKYDEAKNFKKVILKAPNNILNIHTKDIL